MIWIIIAHLHHDRCHLTSDTSFAEDKTQVVSILVRLEDDIQVPLVADTRLLVHDHRELFPGQKIFRQLLLSVLLHVLDVVLDNFPHSDVRLVIYHPHGNAHRFLKFTLSQLTKVTVRRGQPDL